MIDGVILVGGFPRPIGGVTTFVRRLAASDRRVREVVDMYRGREKAIPPGYRGKYRRLNRRWLGFLYLLCRSPMWGGKYVHFNFSKLGSLLFLAPLPKFRTKWILMLHHGVLESRLPDALLGRILRRCDHVVCMNERQLSFYRRLGVPDRLVVEASSYVHPVGGAPDQAFRREIDAYFSAQPTFVASGYPTREYNFDWCVRFVSEHSGYQLALFVYGDGPVKQEIREQLGRRRNVRVYWEQSEDNFNYALSRAFWYLRPNRRDSFGIAVADAVNYGVPVLASAVCRRFQGARIFEISTYEGFEKTLLDALRGNANVAGAGTEPIVPFSYDLIK